MTGSDEKYMRRAIELARRGGRRVHPNPQVGAVIVKDGCVTGEGWHEEYGSLHAERNALASLGDRGAAGATMYVTLEPCCHFGKQPPCTEAIIEAGIKRVVVGSRDPNPEVSGKGVEILRQAGIEVVEDCLRDECDSLNPVFFHYITKKRPYVIMKFAMTADGKIATKTGASRWISGEESRHRVHEYRHKCMGIMAGIGTVLADDPLLNCRIDGGIDPVRIICDSSLRLPEDSRIVATAGSIRTIIACCFSGDEPGGELRSRIDRLKKAGIEILSFPSGEGDGRVPLAPLMDRLGEMGIDSLLLEGGGSLNESALRSGIVNEIHVFIAPKIFGGKAASPVMGEGVSLPSECYRLKMLGAEPVGEDLLVRYKVLC